MIKEKILKLFSLSNIVWAIILLLFILAIITNYNKQEGTTNCDISVRMVWNTGSMWDYGEEQVYVLEREFEEPILNRVYVYNTTQNSLNFRIAHRLVNITNGTYIFKGDKNDYLDEPIERKDIISEVYGTVEGWFVNETYNPIEDTYWNSYVKSLNETIK